MHSAVCDQCIMWRLRRVHLAALCCICAVHCVEVDEDAAQTTTEAVRMTNDFVRSYQNEAQTPTEPPNVTSDPPYVMNRVNFDADFNSTFDDYSDLSIDEKITDSSDYSYAQSANGTGNSARLFSGTAAAAGAFPFALHLLSTVPAGTRPCTAALITAEYAITAASCVHDATTIAVTANTLDGMPGTATTGTAIVHPKYYQNTYDYDIALVKLLTPYTLSSTIYPIDIAFKFNTDSSKDLTGSSVRVIAFGEATANTATYLLNSQFMKVLSRSRCLVEMRKRNIRPSITQDCLDTDNGLVGGCNPADIGGIVTFKFDTDSAYKLAGVLNYYYTCGSATPNLFTRVGPFWDLIRKYVPTYANIG